MEKYNARADVPEKYKWDLTDIFKDIDDFNKVFNEIKDKLKLIDNYVGCTKDSNKLLEYIIFDIDLSSKILNLIIYAMFINDQDLNDSIGVELVGRTNNIDAEYSAKSSFFEPELLSLTEEEYNDLFKNQNLIKYKGLLDDIYRFKEHILTENEEELVARLTNISNNYSQLSSTLLNNCNNYGIVKMEDGSNETLMTTNYRRIMKKLPREKRKEVYNQFNKVLDEYSQINAGLLDSYVKTAVQLAKIHKFNSTWEQKLFDLKLNDKVFNSLIESALSTKNVLKKYYDLKSKVLKIDKCTPWDSPIELYKTEKEYTIEEACDLVLNSLKPLGEDYVNHFRNVIDDRCVDFCQYKGKCSGGYNASSNTVKNSKILMSFNYDLASVSTLAHEAGHHVHHQYLFENNIEVYRDVPVIVAEVASLTNEFLLSDYLINSGNKEEALSGLSNIISIFQDNFYGGIQEGNLEQEFYKYVENGGTLTKDYLNDITEKSLLKFYPKDKLDNEYEKISWITRSHYYMFYYLFSYSICVCVASYVSKEILSGNKKMLDKYIEFLKTGNEKNVSDIFKILGINLEDKNVYISATNNFELLIDKFNKLYDE